MVAPFAGAWIEIVSWLAIKFEAMSLPSRERGLKCYMASVVPVDALVAPFAGAWIEI